MNELLGGQTRGFHRFPTRRNDFFPTFLIFVSVDPWTETMNMHVQEESKLVPGVVACCIQHFQIGALTQKVSPESGY